MATLNFTTGNSLKQSLRPSLTKYNKSKLRYNFEVSEGQRVAEVFYPSKYLPVQFQDVWTEDFVVIPKGKVVSALGIGDYGLTTDASGMGSVSGALSIPVFTNRAGTVVTSAHDGTYWGYDESVAGLLVPCNGGTDRTTSNSYEYSTLDVTAGTFKSLSAVAAAGDDVGGILSSGNMPIGAAMYDIYQDIRGKYMNYDMWDKWGILNDWYVTMPFVAETNYTGLSNYKALAVDASKDDDTLLDALRRFTYLSIPNGTVARTGSSVQADVRGNYVIQSAAVTGNITNQTVGRLVALDCRWPKDMQEYVDTYEGSQMSGTDTGGIPYWLFLFAYTYLNAANGTAPSINNITSAIKAGNFGMARVQLHIN